MDSSQHRYPIVSVQRIDGYSALNGSYLTYLSQGSLRNRVPKDVRANSDT